MEESPSLEQRFNVNPDIEQWEMEERTHLESLRKKVNRILGRQTEALKIPKVSVDIYYGIHGTQEDAKKIVPHFQDCDIYVPEMLGWSKKRLDIVNQVAAGKIQPLEAARMIGYYPEDASHDFQLLEMVYNSGKTIVYVDYQLDDAGFKETMDTTRGMANITQYFIFRGDYHKIIENIKMSAKKCAESDARREEFIVNNLRTVIGNTVANNPELRKRAKQKGELKVLMSLGLVHTPVSHILNKSGNETHRRFSKSPYIYSYINEGIRKYRFGKDVDDELAARMLGEGLLDAVFDKELKRAFPSGEERANFFRKITSQLTYEDVEGIIKNNPDGQLKPLKNYLLNLIRQKTSEFDTALSTKQIIPTPVR